jgi:folylpolyglutamate synthase/dihydropteroate synthase
MLDPLLEPLRGAALIATRVPGTPNSLDPRRLAAAWGAGAVAIADPDRAFGSAVDRASSARGPLIVCGSLYLVGYARTKLGLEPAQDQTDS